MTSAASLRIKLIPVLAGWGGLACSSATGPSPPPPPPPPPPTGIGLVATTVVSGLEQPVFATAPPGDPRLFIVEKTGRIQVLSAAGQLLETPFLDLVGQVDVEPEGGLLTAAFHPSFGTNGFVYVNYTNRQGHTVVARYTVSGNPDRLDASTAKQILTVTQRRGNHNGGMIEFGPDGMLYVFMGDEGGAGDPFGNGQNPSTLHGSILRLDVDGGDPYAIPADNPFRSSSTARQEIWAYGVRNPWRSTFDAPAGVLYVADVGQNSREEVNAVPVQPQGFNFGWNTMEGSTCFNASSCNTSGLTLPVIEYAHTGGACSVTGGYVYRGTQIPEIVGHYFYSDFCAGFLRSFRLSGQNSVSDERTWNVGDLGSVSSFGVDGAGELYVVDLAGSVSRLERAP